MTIETILELTRAGKKEEARSLAMEAVASGNYDKARELELGILLVASPDKEQAKVGATLLTPHIEEAALPNDFRSMVAVSMWNACEYSAAVKACRFALRENPQLGHLYRILGMGLTCEHEYERAVFAYLAGIGVTKNAGQHDSWLRVAHALWKGAKGVAFKYNEHTYRFGLDIFGPMTVEAANYHLGGHFTEPEELSYLAKELKPGSRIVELGTLVGNHTLFFLGETKPSYMFLIDGCQQALDVTKANIERTFGPTMPCKIDFVHRFVGRDSRTCVFQGEEVQQDNLDTILQGVSYDFIKIDADGGELNLLDGAMQTITANKPAMMLEVQKENRAAAEARLAPLGYKVSWSVDHGGYENLFMRAS